MTAPPPPPAPAVPLEPGPADWWEEDPATAALEDRRYWNRDED